MLITCYELRAIDTAMDEQTKRCADPQSKILVGGGAYLYSAPKRIKISIDNAVREWIKYGVALSSGPIHQL